MVAYIVAYLCEIGIFSLVSPLCRFVLREPDTIRYLLCKVACEYAVGVLFAASHDVGENCVVRDLQYSCEIVKQKLGAREGERLEDSPYMVEIHFHCGSECSFKLCRVVSVVVNDRNALFKAEFFKTALCSAELIKSLLDSGEVRAEITCSSNCRKGVEDVVDTCNMEGDLSE